MEIKKDFNQEFDIPFAKRTYLKANNSETFKKIILILPFFLLFISYTGLQLNKNLRFLTSKNYVPKLNKNDDPRILGHLPDKEISKFMLTWGRLF